MIGRASLLRLSVSALLAATSSVAAAADDAPKTAEPAAQQPSFLQAQAEFGVAFPQSPGSSGLSGGPTVAGAFRFGRALKIGPSARVTRLGWRTAVPSDEYLWMREFGLDVRWEGSVRRRVIPYVGAGLGLTLNEPSVRSDYDEIGSGGYLNLAIGADWAFDSARLGLGVNLTWRGHGASGSSASGRGDPSAPYGDNSTAGAYLSGAYDF
jgi:opacity protein-like surface antigen